MARVESGEVCKTVGERIANRMPGGGRNQETMALFGYLGILHPTPTTATWTLGQPPQPRGFLALRPQR